MAIQSEGISVEEVLSDLADLGNEKFKDGLKRFGIKSKNALGIKLPVLRDYAKHVGTNHELALSLWETEVHEARLLAVFIADKNKVSEELMEHWVIAFNSWDICDQACALFDRTPYAFNKATEWAKREEEFVKRAGFVLMAELAVHDKKAADEKFSTFFKFIIEEADDDRNFVKKAINWALRQIGKRNSNLNTEAIAAAKIIRNRNSKSARWIAADALRELTSEHTKRRLLEKRSLKRII
ncbi:DNA alkylation repair protein [Rubrolithibacter danxiaensis]|uniref:DNA alkylation repair protein n=1 Tax=Rubrolithibacter danxiaensis TaxID=3390805 RepID=UPI003BF8D3B0